MSSRSRRTRGDEGVSLVLALLFIALVGLFATVALAKSQTTLASGQQLRERGKLQYALDGAVDRGLQVLRSEMAGADPATCAQPSSPTASGTLTLNGSTTTWTCTLLAGRAKRSSDATSTDFALVVTSPDPGALTSQSGTSSDVQIGGSTYLNGRVTDSDLKKQIVVSGGDVVSPASRAGCDADLAAMTKVSVGSGYLKACTEQTLAQALPTVSLPAAPTFDVSQLFPAGVDVTSNGNGNGNGNGNSTTCRVFYPGRYTSPPVLRNGANYFVSGLYYFRGIGTWSFTGNALSVTGGKRSVSSDTATLSDDCSAMTDAKALDEPAVAPVQPSIQSSTFSHGVTWVLGGSSSLDLTRGRITLFTPPAAASSQPLNVVAFGSTTNGYQATSAATAVRGMSNSTEARFNAKIYAPTSGVDIYSTNKTEAVARGGVVAYTLALQASVSGGNGLAISASGSVSTPPPPFRTVSIVSTDTSGGSSTTNRAVATVSNFSPYSVKTKSWRTAD